MKIQASLERDIDFSEVAGHNSMCSRRGLYYQSVDRRSEQADIRRWT